MKVKEARIFIGKVVEWDIDTRFTAFPTRRGLVMDVKGKNIFIGVDWYWLPDIKEFRIIETNT